MSFGPSSVLGDQIESSKYQCIPPVSTHKNQSIRWGIPLMRGNSRPPCAEPKILFLRCLQGSLSIIIAYFLPVIAPTGFHWRMVYRCGVRPTCRTNRTGGRVDRTTRVDYFFKMLSALCAEALGAAISRRLLRTPPCQGLPVRFDGA